MVPRSLRPVLAGLLLAAPFGITGLAAQRVVNPLATSVAVAVTEALTRWAPPAPPPAAREELETEAAEENVLVLDVATQPPGRRAGKLPPRAKPPALFVSRATVLKLAQSSVRPSGSFVAQSAQHPAGLRLAGVAGLGIGLQDGDILIEALGIAPRAPGEIIGAILEARAKSARFLSGTLWRRGDTFRITVEQPYPQHG